MRLIAKISLLKENVSIPAHYRRCFCALIKEALSKTEGGRELKEKYYQGNIQKPFTFSVSLFPDKEKFNEKGKIHLKNPEMAFHFSSSDPYLVMNLYNGLIDLRSYLIFPGVENWIRNFILDKDKDITDEKTVYKTLSPILVRKLIKGSKPEYLSGEHLDFPNVLAKSISTMYHQLTEDEIDWSEIEISPIETETSIINQYGGEKGVKGLFSIKAPLKVQNLIFNVGIGGKRSQGFGMLEVVG